MSSLYVFHAPSKTPPPQTTDMYYSQENKLKSSVFSVAALGFSLAVTCLIVFLLLILFEFDTSFLNPLYPGYDAGRAVASVFVGMLWSFIYGLVTGVLFALIYNSLIRVSVLNFESSETYS